MVVQLPALHTQIRGGRWEENDKQVKNIVFWKHWEGNLVWKGKLAYTYTLLIIQCLCNNYSSIQKINEISKQLNKQNTHTHVFFDTNDEGLWAESQTPSEFKSKSDIKGKARKYLKRESLKNMPVCFS